MIKKIIFLFFIIIFIFIVGLKILDFTFFKFYGLGKPLIYEYSKITGYNIKPSQKLKRLNKQEYISCLFN